MRALWLAALALAGACGDDGAEAEGAARLRDEARVLARIVAEDPTVGALDEVDEAVADGLPVRGAELLARGALPAARRQAERLEPVRLGTPEGRTLRRRLLDAYRARADALEQYRQALRRGEVEDLALVEALGAQRRAEDDIAAIAAEIEALVGGGV